MARPELKRLLEGMTDFEKKVLMETARIPRGETRSYKEMARAIGKPKAARAVGNALRKNPSSMRIPCHRVIRSDGSPGGYSRGERLKRKLLLQESGLRRK